MKNRLLSLPITLAMLLTYHDSIRLSQIVVEGVVLSEGSLKPIPDAYVYTVSGEEEVLTDKQGRFKLTTWQALPLSLTVEHNNFETLKVRVTNLPANQSIKLKRK